MDANFKEARFSGMAKSLLNQLQTRQITIEEFLKECGYWALRDDFDELRVIPLPTPPNTAAYQEYVSLPLQRRQRLDASFFQKNFEINEYYKQRFMVIHKNKATMGWLEEIAKYIPEEDYPNQGKIRERLLSFKEFFQGLNDIPEEVGKAKEIFNGEYA